MDHLTDVYANVEEPSGKKKRLSKSPVSVYEDVWIETLEPNRTGATLSGMKKSSCRAAAVVLGLLCLLLLTGLITLVCLFSKGNFEWETKMNQLQNNYTNLTKKSDQLKTRYTNLNKERDQLQTSYTDLNKERDQLQTSYTDLNKERDQLQTSNTNLNKERDQLQTSNNNLANVQEKLQKRVEELAKQRTDLQEKIRDQYAKQGWVYYSGSMYYISSLAKSWLESRAYCVQRCADLVIINSEEEQKFISNFQKPIWIGLTDREMEGRWKWVDGTPLTKSFWNPLEPNGKQFNGDEDCVEMNALYFHNNWNDDNCNKDKIGICEKMLPP